MVARFSTIFSPVVQGTLLRLNPRARLSPALCFVGSPSRFPNRRETLTPVPPTKHFGSIGSGAACCPVAPGTNGQQKRRTYMYTMNQLTIIGLFRKYSPGPARARGERCNPASREPSDGDEVSLSAALALDFFSSFSVWCFCAKDLID